MENTAIIVANSNCNQIELLKILFWKKRCSINSYYFSLWRTKKKIYPTFLLLSSFNLTEIYWNIAVFNRSSGFIEDKRKHTTSLFSFIQLTMKLLNIYKNVQFYKFCYLFLRFLILVLVFTLTGYCFWKWVSEWVSEWVGGWVSEWVSEWASLESLNKCTVWEYPFERALYLVIFYCNRQSLSTELVFVSQKSEA